MVIYFKEAKQRYQYLIAVFYLVMVFGKELDFISLRLFLLKNISIDYLQVHKESR